MRMPALLLLFCLALTACEQEMAEQRKLDTYEPAPTYVDDTSARPVPPGAVAFADPSEEVQPEHAADTLVERGRQNYETFCTPCHGRSGRGDGIVVQRGFPAPPSFLIARLRRAPAEHYVNVITNGHGVMYSYADRVPEPDRQAIVAYIRALQLAQSQAWLGEGEP